jgi:hypothetical protein
MSDDLGLGKLITEPRGRDAVHVAVIPATASEWMEPGCRVRLVEGSVDLAESSLTGEPFLGVVDPFLDRRVEQGERFWLWLIPGTVTSLRHVWTHPAFRPQPPKAVRD